MDQPQANYRVVSEITYNGQCVAVPDDAIDVTVEPLASPGAARVTYLQRLRDVCFDDDGAEQEYIY